MPFELHGVTNQGGTESNILGSAVSTQCCPYSAKAVLMTSK